MARKYGRSYPNKEQWLKEQKLSETKAGLYEIKSHVGFDLVRMVAEGVARNMASASEEVKKLAVLLAKDEIPPHERQRAHRYLGEEARKAVLGAYSRRPYRRDLPSYRTTARDPRNIRYAGGRLFRALDSPSMYEATAEGLKFINVTLLNKEAKQWRRLNFGAGVPDRSRRFKVYFGDLLVGAMGLDSGKQPGKVKLPPGRFVEPGSGGKAGAAQARGAPGSGMFYPLGELRGKDVYQKMKTGSYKTKDGKTTLKGPRTTPGLTIQRPMFVQIQASNFLDAGVRAIADNLGDAYSEMYARYYVNQQNLMRQRKNPTSVKLPAPIKFSSRGETIRRNPIKQVNLSGPSYLGEGRRRWTV